MTDRIPGAPGRCKAVITAEELQKLQSGNEFAITLRRDDAPVAEGTPYSKATVLPDAVAEKLCPGVVDPTPGDAFGVLQSQKADTVRKAVGSSIRLSDAAHTPLRGLKLYGADGKNVTVSVMGKNIANVYGYSAHGITNPNSNRSLTNNYGTTLSTTDASDTIEITQSTFLYPSDSASYQNGYFCIGLHNSLKAGDVVTVSFDVEITRNLSNNNTIMLMPNGGDGVRTKVNNGKFECAVSWWNYEERQYLEIRTAGKSMIISNLQIEYGETATAYEPYKESQICKVSVPDGVGEQGFTCAEFAKLHTYAPTTTIINDAGAAMEVTYYTPTTAVQMVHTPADKDKLFSIDAHGCAILVERETVTGKVTQALQEHGEDMGNPHNVTADQLDIVDFILEQDDREALKWRKWASGLAECWGEMSVYAEGSAGNPDHCNLFSDLPLHFTRFDSVQVTVLDNDPDLLMSVLNVAAEAEWERLVVRFGVMSGGGYTTLNQPVNDVRLFVRVNGTAR